MVIFADINATESKKYVTLLFGFLHTIFYVLIAKIFHT